MPLLCVHMCVCVPVPDSINRRFSQWNSVYEWMNEWMSDIFVPPGESFIFSSVCFRARFCFSLDFIIWLFSCLFPLLLPHEEKNWLYDTDIDKYPLFWLWNVLVFFSRKKVQKWECMLSTKQTFPLFVFIVFPSTTSKKCVFIYIADYTTMMTLSLCAGMCAFYVVRQTV